MWRAFLGAVLVMVGAECLAQAERPVEVLISPEGRVSLSRGGRQFAAITPGLYEKEWRGATLGGPVSRERVAPDLRVGRIRAPGGTVVDCELRPQVTEDGVTLSYRLTPRADVFLNSLHVSLDFPASVLRGGRYVADGDAGPFPDELDEVQLRSAPTEDLRIEFADGGELRLRYPEPTHVLLQDNRLWGQSFSARMGPQTDATEAWPAGRALDLTFTLTASGGVNVEFDAPVTIEAGDEWVPLKLELDIEEGSALDFSGFGQLEAPAGKHGWLIARPDGQLAFEDSPETARRFYGVNFCFSAHYIPHEQADRVAERLTRLGYNTVRFHHFERELVDRSNGRSTELNPEKLDQLDYLFAALKKRGIYLTLDLFISRPVFAAEIWPGATGDVAMNDFKMLVPVNAEAMANWKAFSRNLLTHVNPHTGLRWADDPALGWISMINEGNFGNYIGGVKDRVREDWQRGWNRWLAGKYDSRARLAEAWGDDPGGDPGAGDVPLPGNPREESARGNDLAAFLAQTEREMFGEMRRFLREEIGTRALLTNANGWTNLVQGQVARQDYDYVDDHFYVDHPRFLERSWSLPSRCDNTSPVAAGAPGGRHCAFTRLLDKPFTISEYNYSGPGRFRGVGGIITGCMAALQDWSVVWRFTYSHNRDNLTQPAPAGYFDLATDALNQAAERASVCLFLRRDMKPAPHTVAIAMTESEVMDLPGRQGNVAPSWHALALIARVGTYVGTGADTVPADLVLPLGDEGAWQGNRGQILAVDPYSGGAGHAIVSEMRKRKWLSADNETDLGAKRSQSETGELLVDGPRDVLVLNTPMTAGGYAPAGESIEAGPVKATIEETDATVWVSSLDGNPIGSSRRLLITHLTDLQNTGAHFGERARQTLLAWGGLPHLVRTGRATVRLAHDEAANAEVWVLATSGRRVAKVEAQRQGREVAVPLNVQGPEGACMMYEVVIGD